ncbi:MAG: glycosyltransferase family 4 protein [Candidatus Thermoplasmatota archaeon]
MKIIQACIRFPPAPGGVEAHVSSISNELKKIGHEVIVFTSDLYMEIPLKRLKNYTDTKDIRRFRAYTIGGEAHYIFMPSMLSAFLKENFDIIHCHSYGYFHLNIGAFVKKIRGKKLVLTPHFHPEWSMWGGKKRKFLRKIYDKFFSKIVLESIDRIIFVSKKEMELMGIENDRCVVIPNGVDINRFSTMLDGKKFRNKYGLEDDKVVLFVGRLASNKGLDFLMECIPNIIKEHRKTKFVFVGEDSGMYGRLLEIIKNLEINENVLFTGHLSEELLISAYKACDILVLPSEYEAFGIVLLEAMACAKPCIGTRVGGITDVIDDGKNGITVEYGKKKEMEEAIVHLLENEKVCKNMGICGKRKVEEKFTWEKITKEIENVYKGIN